MNLQMEINSLKQRISELEKQAKQEQEFPQYGNTYWCINSYGGVSKEIWDGCDIEKDMFEIGNMFRTKEQADFAVEKLKVEAELRKFSKPFKVGKSNTEFYYWHESRRIMFNHFKTCQMQGSIYFESEEKAQQAIETVGEERIKKYIFGVED